MYELLYTSVRTRFLSDRDLAELLTQARARNEIQKITGMLIFNGMEFAQILEGKETDVRDIFASIERDERHTSVNVFYAGAISRRTFADWTMAFQLFDESKRNLLGPGFEEFKAEHLPHHLLNANPNVGKELFLSLSRDLL